MRKVTYEQALADHAYLWRTYGAAEDMTGGYVDQEDLALMLANPTKRQARDCLVSQIEYWFDMGPDSSGTGRRPDEADERLQEISERYDRSIPA